MEELSERVLNKIKEEKITPVPRWRFLLQDSVTWITFFISLILGAIAISVSLYLYYNNDLSDTPFGNLEILLLSIPFLWLLITGFFLFLSYYNFKHTPGGYRFTVARIFVVNLLLSFIIGLALFSSGVSDKLNTLFKESIPYYEQLADPRYRVWMQPDSGLLAGEILSSSENELILKDLKGNNWNIDISNAQFRPAVSLEPGTRVKLTGQRTGVTSFAAEALRPWSGRGNVKGWQGAH